MLAKPDVNEPEWEKIGTLCIDTATLLLCDPIHAQHADDLVDKLVKGSSDSASVTRKGYVGGAVAIAAMTGLGDGAYDVLVRRADMGQFGTRIAEIKIVFWPHPQLSEGE